MNTRLVPRLVLVALATVATSMASADVITLQIAGVPGDVKTTANIALPADAIEVISVGGDFTNVSSSVGGGSGTGKPILSDLSIVKKLSASTPSLFLALVTGRHYPEGTIRFYRTTRGGLELYYSITLREIFVTSQKWLGTPADSDSSDREGITLSFSRITLLDEVSGDRACYDVKTTATC